MTNEHNEHPHIHHAVPQPAELSMSEQSAATENASSNTAWYMPTAVVIAGLLIGGAIYGTGLELKNALTVSGAPVLAGANPSAGTPTGNAGSPSAPSGAAAPAANTAQVLALGSRDIVLGSASAPVTVIEYADYQCPFCHRWNENVLPSLKSQYISSNKVKFVYRNFPFLGQESQLAAQAAECAKDQGKFWAYHDGLMAAETQDGQENNGNITRDWLMNVGKTAGLDTAKLGSCFDAGKYNQYVQQEKTGATSIGVSGTPMTFINGELVQGAQPFSAFQTVIDKYLKK